MADSEFDLQPTLVGALIKIRPLAIADFADLYSCASDFRIWEQHPQRNRHEKPVFQNFFDSALDSRGAFAVLDLKTNKIIGSSRYYDLDTQNDRVTIGYTFLKTDYWGGTFNRELKSLMLNHAFRFVESVVFEIGANNLRSRAAIEKIGAKLIRNDTFDDAPHVVYEISRQAFSEISD